MELEAGKKQGRAMEMDLWRRYENIMVLFENGTLPLDTAKLEFVLKIANLKSEASKSTSWEDFYIELFPEVQEDLGRLRDFMSKDWVKHTISPQPL